MGVIDYHKAYDLVPQVLHDRELKYDEHSKTRSKYFWKKEMKSWSVELTCGTETLGEVPIKRWIF